MASISEMRMSIVQTMAELIDSALAKAEFDRTVKGIVVEVKTGNRYVVKINNTNYDAKSRLSLNVNEVVYVIKPGNKFKDLVIVG